MAVKTTFLLTSILLLLGSIAPAFSETLFGGSFTLGETVYLSGTNGKLFQDTEGRPGVVQSGELSLFLSSFAEGYTFEADLSASYEQHESLQIAMPRLMLETSPLPWTVLRAGRFVQVPGNAEFRSPLDFLSQTDPEALLSGRLDSVRAPADLLQAALFVGPAFLRLTTSLLRPELRLPETDSIWFPRRQIPDLVVRLDEEYLLRSIYYAPAEPDTFSFDDPSILAELGGSFYAVDATLLGYAGYTTDLILRPRVVLDFLGGGPARPYDAELDPIQERVAALGGAVATSLGGFRLYGETATIFNRPSVMALETWQEEATIFERNDPAPIYRSRVTELNAGGSYQGYWDLAPTDGLQWFLLAEYFDTYGYPEDASLPLLARFVATSLQLSTYRPALTLGLQSVWSLRPPEDSYALVLQADWEATPGLSFSALLPLFWGESESELGQYSENRLLRVEVTASF